MSVHDASIGNINARLEAIDKQLLKLKGKGGTKERGSLTEEQCQRLFEIVRPGSPENPFKRHTQRRNFLLFLAYYELGVRKSEPLVMKGTHMTGGARRAWTVIFTPDDPRDPRLDQPSVKTLSRLLPVGAVFAATYDKYLRDDRISRTNPTQAMHAKKTQFIILGTRSGLPLSLDAVYDMFRVVRSRFPTEFPTDFAPHHLRRSWNYRFSHACEAANIDKKLQDHLHRYIMGWSKTSAQPANYNRKFIEEQAFKILLRMQDAMTGVLS